MNRDVFLMPHGLAVGANDNVWTTDVGLHQVLQFTHDGALVRAFGTAREPGDDEAHFNLPTDVVVLPDGGFYVSYGYENSRVVRCSPSGKFVASWGTAGTREGQFDLPHGIAWDGHDTLYVADRGNSRLQGFSLDGEFKFSWSGEHIGRPFGVEVSPAGDVAVVDGGHLPASGPDRSRVVVLDTVGHLKRTLGSFGSQDGQFRLGHDVAIGPDGAIYVVDTWGRRVQKFVEAPGRSRDVRRRDF